MTAKHTAEKKPSHLEGWHSPRMVGQGRGGKAIASFSLVVFFFVFQKLHLSGTLWVSHFSLLYPEHTYRAYIIF
jgi:hypothetical protein